MLVGGGGGGERSREREHAFDPYRPICQQQRSHRVDIKFINGLRKLVYSYTLVVTRSWLSCTISDKWRSPFIVQITVLLLCCSSIVVCPTAEKRVHRGGGWMGGDWMGGVGGEGQFGRRGQLRCGWGGGGVVTLPSTQCLKASEEKAVERTDDADADGREGVTECVRDCLSQCDRYDCQV